MVKILHFADAHIDIANQGRRDPQSGLPVRVLDFLKSLDKIVDTAIEEKVDLVIFAGDAYKDRSPAPTFQREWGKRMIRLSLAGIPTILLVGNHDRSPALGRANALQEFDTLQVPHIWTISQPTLLKPGDLEGLPVQVMAIPWVSRSGLMNSLGMSASQTDLAYQEIESRLEMLVNTWLGQINPALPVVLTAHASIEGAKYGSERSVMLGADVTLAGRLVRNPQIDYVALGHIHKAQNLNENAHPPVIYPGSIERVDFGEARDEKFFVVAEVNRGSTHVTWHKLEGRNFIDRFIKITSPDNIFEQVVDALPDQSQLEDSIVRLTIEYPHDWESLINEPDIRAYLNPAFEFHFIRRPQIESRLRLPSNQTISSLTPEDLLEIYWKSINTPTEEMKELQTLAKDIIQHTSEPDHNEF